MERWVRDVWVERWVRDVWVGRWVRDVWVERWVRGVSALGRNVPSMQPFPITILYLIWLVTAHIAQGMLGAIMTWEGISPKIPA